MLFFVDLQREHLRLVSATDGRQVYFVSDKRGQAVGNFRGRTGRIQSQGRLGLPAPAQHRRPKHLRPNDPPQPAQFSVPLHLPNHHANCPARRKWNDSTLQIQPV